MPRRAAPGNFIAYCESHRKRLYTTRKGAKQAIGELKDNKGMREYACDAFTGFFHVGHLPRATVVGEKTAREVYGPTKEEVTNP